MVETRKRTVRFPKTVSDKIEALSQEKGLSFSETIVFLVNLGIDLGDLLHTLPAKQSLDSLSAGFDQPGPSNDLED